MSMDTKVRKVNVIQPKVDLFRVDSNQEYRKKRVAAYARVSTDEEEQLSSYEAQVDSYTRRIQGNPEWEFVEVYADDAVIIGLS